MGGPTDLALPGDARSFDIVIDQKNFWLSSPPMLAIKAGSDFLVRSLNAEGTVGGRRLEEIPAGQ